MSCRSVTASWRRARTCLACLLFGVLLGISTARSATQELLVEVDINTSIQRDLSLVLLDENRQLHLKAADLKSWGIRVTPDRSSVRIWEGEAYLPVAFLPGIRAHLDSARQYLELKVLPALMPETVIRSSPLSPQFAEPSLPGAFLGYSVAATEGNESGGLAGQFEVGFFNGGWRATTEYLSADSEHRSRPIRLDSAFVRDFPARRRSLRLGDSLSRAPLWKNPLRYGGLQWSTDASLQPGYVSFPMPALRGSAEVPSVVDLYVNNALQLRQSVPAGPFELRDLPLTSGSNTLRMSVRDALGKEVVVEQTYFLSTRLLEPGVADWSVDLGAVRENYLSDNFEYAGVLFAGGYRRGLTKTLTGEWYGSVEGDRRIVGMSALQSVFSLATLHQSVALSTASHGEGWLVELGAEITKARLSGGLSARLASEAFDKPFPDFVGHAPVTSSFQSSVGLQLGQGGTLGASYIYRGYADRTRAQLVALNSGVSFGLSGYVTVTAMVDLDDRGAELSVMFTRPWGKRGSSTVGTSVRDKDFMPALSVTQNLPAGDGLGYSLKSQPNSTHALQAVGRAKTEFGTFAVEYSRYRAKDFYQAFASGGLVMLDGHVAATRSVDGGFALVEIPSQQGVEIFNDNHPVGHTDRHGIAILTGLRAYEENRFHVGLESLDRSVDLEITEQSVVPYRRGGNRVEFPISSHGGALFQLVDDQNEFLPPGVVVQSSVGLLKVALEGTVFVPSSGGPVDLEATWRGHRCKATVMVPANELLPHLGRIRCGEMLL